LPDLIDKPLDVMPAYIGRFAPSPTGPLHAGSLVAALASWLDARAHRGRWLVRIEDVDTPRCVPGADRLILQQLDACGLMADEPPLWQSKRAPQHAAALERLQAAGMVYPCGCSRRDIDLALAAQGAPVPRHGERVYPGTCRNGLKGKPARAWRVRMGSNDDALCVAWHDRRLGPQHQDVTHAVGDFVLRRADGLWAYQLAVVVDDAAQCITDVVRGADLADNTARQIQLQRLLGLPVPHYLHTPLVLGADGQKLSKQNGAAALDTGSPAAVLVALRAAAQVLGLRVDPGLTAADRSAWLEAAVRQWAAAWGRPGADAGADAASASASASEAGRRR
jgi:glutamyl-Q tRNA(Asp) synthetase